MKNKIYWGWVVGSLLLLSTGLTPALAGESSAINGAENYYAGALPPPGFHVIDYTLYYRATDLKDSNGKTNKPPDFSVTAIANVIRPIYVSDAKVLGASPAWHMVIPIVYQKIKAGGVSDSETGLGDIYFSPLLLGWHREVFHWVAGLDIIAPTGKYDVNALSNIGKNHWTIEPAFAVSAITKQGFTGSAKFMYDIHTENQDTNLTTGDQLHIDYGLGYKVTDNWSLGFGGYWLKGLQNDTQNGVKVADSIQEVFAIGPNVMFTKDKLSIVLQPDFELNAKNRPEGIATWLKVVYSF